MDCKIAVAALCLVLAPFQPGRAAVLDDFLAQGYAIVAATTLPGSFTGCVKQRRLVFADGSVFACARTAAQTAFGPRVYILRTAGDPPSVVLVGAFVQAGELLRLKLHDYPVPLRMNADPLPLHHATPATAVQPLGAVPSINTVMQMQHAPLQQQQDRLPERRRDFRSNR